MTGRLHSSERGQVLVIVAVAMLAVIGMVALVIDGGYAWGQQRNAQNGADAAAEAGAIVLLRHLAGPTSQTDADVEAAVLDTADRNSVTVDAAYYTNLDGDLLRSDGSVASGTGDAAEVGGGTIPPCSSGCAGSSASGVHVEAERTFQTFFAGVIGFGELTAGAEATAISGYISDPCASAEGCILLPVTVPVNIVTCLQNGLANPTTTPYQKYTPYTIPLCRNNPGNVGWIDWDPPGGGSSELEGEILNPTPRNVVIPEWYYVTETGDTNSLQVENALNTYVGQVVMIPMFDSTCNIEPQGTGVTDCPPENVGGEGVNQWYHFPQFGAFLLEEPKAAFISGSDAATCDTGNGATSCLKGMFVDFVTEGAVGMRPEGATSTTAFYGVQLIR